MRVLKFGGTSVADETQIQRVLEIIGWSLKEGPICVVSSAMGGATDSLVNASVNAAAGSTEYERWIEELADRHMSVVEAVVTGEERKETVAAVEALVKELRDLLHGVRIVRECSPRSLDLICSFGERLSCTILAAALRSAGIAADFVDARDIIRTDATHGDAEVDFAATYELIRLRLGPAVHDASGTVRVVTGFIGSTADGITTTLGRNKSDFTASLLAAGLEAEAIEIWTDVDGVLSADPRCVANAFVLPQISFQEAMELSYFGAKVIHPYTMIPAVEHGIPLRIKNTNNPASAGTIIAEHTSSKAQWITGIASVEAVALINVEGGGMVGIPGVAGRIFSALAAARISIIMISQASSEHSICFIVRDEEAERAVSALQDELVLELSHKRVERLQVERDLEIVAVIGENMKGRPGISGKLFGALGDNAINVLAIAQGSSEMNISFVVHNRDRERALNAVHDAFFPRSEE